MIEESGAPERSGRGGVRRALGEGLRANGGRHVHRHHHGCGC